MLKIAVRALAVVTASQCLFGCAATQNISDAKRITLSDALVDTVDALSAAHEESVAKHSHFGFYGCTITAAFNVSATATGDNKLALTASSPPTFPVVLGGSASTESTASGTKGNTVTVVLATPYCLPETKTSKAAGAKPAARGAVAGKPAMGSPTSPSTPAKPTVTSSPSSIPGMVYPPPVINSIIIPKNSIMKIEPDKAVDK